MTTVVAGPAYQRPPLYAKQLDALFCPERYAIVEATSKAGKTVGCMAWLMERAVQGRAGQNYWWVAPILAQADIPFGRMKRGLPASLYTTNETKRTLTLLNGAVIWFKGADNPDSLYGEDVYAAVLDEATRMREEAFHAVRSTLTATRGPIRIIGNVKGRKNWAYKLARRAESGESDMHYAKITAPDAVEAGILDAAEIEDARRALPDAVFRELYLAEPSDDQGNPFGFEAIRACIGPLSSDAPVRWGWDLARSVDWTVGVGLDKLNRVCRLERWQYPGDSLGWTKTKLRIRELTGHAPALVDSTGVGDPVFEDLHREGGGNFESFKFTATSKQQLMEGLTVRIQQRQTRFPEGILSAELEAFEYVYSRTGVKYSAPEGMHDDCVMALALALAHASNPEPNVRTIAADGDGGGVWQHWGTF